MWTASRPTSPRCALTPAAAAAIGPGLSLHVSEQVIVNVGQSESDAPWPLRILDHSGEAHDITLEPGEALFYESARLLHARPEPLQGQVRNFGGNLGNSDHILGRFRGDFAIVWHI